jgi:hypothetical protein
MRGQRRRRRSGTGDSALKEQVDYWIEHRSDKMVETIQLYYDDEGWNGRHLVFLFVVKMCA